MPLRSELARLLVVFKMVAGWWTTSIFCATHVRSMVILNAANETKPYAPLGRRTLSVEELMIGKSKNEQMVDDTNGVLC